MRRCGVVQSRVSLTQAHHSEGDGHSFTYPLDGKEHRLVMSSHGEDIVTLATATWKDNRIVIQQKTTCPNGRVVHSTQTWGWTHQPNSASDCSKTCRGSEPTTLTAKRKQ